MSSIPAGWAPLPVQWQHTVSQLRACDSQVQTKPNLPMAITGTILLVQFYLGGSSSATGHLLSLSSQCILQLCLSVRLHGIITAYADLVVLKLGEKMSFFFWFPGDASLFPPAFPVSALVQTRTISCVHGAAAGHIRVRRPACRAPLSSLLYLPHKSCHLQALPSKHHFRCWWQPLCWRWD